MAIGTDEWSSLHPLIRELDDDVVVAVVLRSDGPPYFGYLKQLPLSVGTDTLIHLSSPGEALGPGVRASSVEELHLLRVTDHEMVCGATIDEHAAWLNFAHSLSRDSFRWCLTEAGGDRGVEALGALGPNGKKTRPDEYQEEELYLRRVLRDILEIQQREYRGCPNCGRSKYIYAGGPSTASRVVDGSGGLKGLFATKGWSLLAGAAKTAGEALALSTSDYTETPLVACSHCRAEVAACPACRSTVQTTWPAKGKTVSCPECQAAITLIKRDERTDDLLGGRAGPVLPSLYAS